jgi:hypothetical protein
MTAHKHQFRRQSTTLPCRRVRSGASDLKPLGVNRSQRPGMEMRALVCDRTLLGGQAQNTEAYRTPGSIQQSTTACSRQRKPWDSDSSWELLITPIAMQWAKSETLPTKQEAHSQVDEAPSQASHRLLDLWNTRCWRFIDSLLTGRKSKARLLPRLQRANLLQALDSPRSGTCGDG